MKKKVGERRERLEPSSSGDSRWICADRSAEERKKRTYESGDETSEREERKERVRKVYFAHLFRNEFLSGFDKSFYCSDREQRENRKGVLLIEREEERLESQEVRELPVKEEQAYSLMNAS